MEIFGCFYWWCYSIERNFRLKVLRLKGIKKGKSFGRWWRLTSDDSYTYSLLLLSSLIPKIPFSTQLHSFQFSESTDELPQLIKVIFKHAGESVAMWEVEPVANRVGSVHSSSRDGNGSEEMKKFPCNLTSFCCLLLCRRHHANLDNVVLPFFD